MNKFLFLGAILLVFCGFKSHQKKEGSLDTNPFSGLLFKYGPTDTVHLTVNFIKTGEISEDNKSTLSLITKNTNFNFKNLSYAIGFTVPGCTRTFYAPSKDSGFLRKLKSNGGSAGKISISCVVYRFYFIDDACNFFIIDKASIAE